MVDFLERGVRKFKREGFRAHRALITQTRPGDLFVERNPGNTVPVYDRHTSGESASVEYAVEVLKVEHLKTHPSVARRLRPGKLALHGWVYDIREGEILQLSERTGEFLPWP